jgi:hypothetical protein
LTPAELGRLVLNPFTATATAGFSRRGRIKIGVRSKWFLLPFPALTGTHFGKDTLGEKKKKKQCDALATVPST